MKKFLFLTSTLLFINCISQAQTNSEQHMEIQNDPYVVVDKSVMPRQIGFQQRQSEILTTQVNVDANGMDIIGDAANEPSIAVDPTNPSRIVIGWRQFDDISSDFRQAGYGYSLDGGQTFTFPGVLEPGVFRSDPVLDFDADGNFYYNSLQSGFSCDVFQINDGGTIWEGPYPAGGGDKQWMRMDRTGGIGDKNNYSFWNPAFSVCSPGGFTRSTDGSFTFEDCLAVEEDPRWGTLAVDKLGDLFMVGTTGAELIVVKSSTAKDPGATVSWDFVTPVDLDGVLDAWTPLNPQGLTGQAWVDVGATENPGLENVYVTASVLRAPADPSDVMFSKSEDGGLSFSPPIKLNTDETGHHNWFATMSVAPNGRIDVVWLDTRDDSNNLLSRLYYTFSEDQGVTWSTNEPLSPSFDSTIGWPQQQKMGDYFDMVSDNEYAHLAWANTINGGQDVYYSRISPEAIVLSNDTTNPQNWEITVLPNPFSDNVTIKFFVPELQKVDVSIYNMNGQRVATLGNRNMVGSQTITWNISSNQGVISSGNYFAVLQSGHKKQVKRLIKM